MVAFILFVGERSFVLLSLWQLEMYSPLVLRLVSVIIPLLLILNRRKKWFAVSRFHC